MQETPPQYVRDRHAVRFATEEFDAFRRAVSETYVPLHVDREGPGGFRGQLHERTIAGTHFSSVSSSSVSVHRTPQLISDADPRYLKVNLQLCGTALILQEGREAVLRPGDIATYDTTRPYTLLFDGNNAAVVAMIPQEQISLPAPSLRESTAIKFSPNHGLTPLLTSFLTELPTLLDQASPSIAQRLSRNATDLVASLLASELGARGPSSSREQLRQEVLLYIEIHLQDLALTPTSIARAHFISVRQLHEVFQASDTSVSEWIRHRRLDQCRKDLSDPVWDSYTIAQIAARWAFVDAAHFSHLFKSRFGLSPRAFRLSSRE